MNRSDLTQILKNIENDYKILKNFDPFLLSKEALNYIGDLDPYLRDDLVLTFLYTMIVKELKGEQIKEILDILLLNINDNIGKINDTVFKRSFSMLLIGAVILRHKNKPFLSLEDINLLFNKVIDSYLLEKDLRGYVDSKGWAHSVAHGADVLKEFSSLEEIRTDMVEKILDVIHLKVNCDSYGYIHNEDERMVRVIVELMKYKKIDEASLIKWIYTYELIKENNINYFVRKINVRNFLRGLYFNLYKNEGYKNIINAVESILENNK